MAPSVSRLLIGELDAFESGAPYRVETESGPVVLVRIDDDVYALADRCSHQNVPLSEGDVWTADREIECYRHGSTFSLETGEAQNLPATQAVAVYEVEIEDGRLYLDPTPRFRA